MTRLDRVNQEILKKSGLLKYFTFNRIMNICFFLGIPEFLKRSHTEKDNIFKYIELSKKQFERELILKLRKEQSSKIYFLKRVNTRLGTILREKEKTNKEEFLKLLKLYIEESETYEDNLNITNKLKNMSTIIEKDTHNWDLIQNILEMEIIIKENESEKPIIKRD